MAVLYNVLGLLLMCGVYVVDCIACASVVCDACVWYAPYALSVLSGL